MALFMIDYDLDKPGVSDAKVDTISFADLRPLLDRRDRSALGETYVLFRSEKELQVRNADSGITADHGTQAMLANRRLQRFQGFG